VVIECPHHEHKKGFIMIDLLSTLSFFGFLFFLVYISHRIKKEKPVPFINIKALLNFAIINNLHFESDSIEDDFRGYRLSIHYKSETKPIREYTIFELKRNQKLSYFEKSQTDKDIISRFWVIYNRIKPGHDPIKQGPDLKITSDMIYFESCPPVSNTDEFLPIIEQLIQLIEICHEVCKIGGEAVDLLLQATKPRKPVIWQIIKIIADETALRIKPKASLLLCKKCLTFCSSHKVKQPFTSSNIFPSGFRYYGCRLCRQSRDFIEVEGRLIAVLDNQMTEEWSVQENVISVNWLAFRKLFDFHEVRIIQASDKEVERFAVQVGNDNDPVRRPLYKKMRCTVAPDCELTENTLRVLRSMFGKVEVKSIASE